MAAAVVAGLGGGLCQTRPGLEEREEAVMAWTLRAMATMALQTLEAVVVGREAQAVTPAARVAQES